MVVLFSGVEAKLSYDTVVSIVAAGRKGAAVMKVCM